MTDQKHRNSGEADGRRDSEGKYSLSGVSVREDDVEPTKGIRFIAYLFRGMAILMLLLAAVQVVSGLSGTVALSFGVLFAEAVRLIIFAGLLWGAGDLAVLAIKSHYDLRATKILVARAEYMMRMGTAGGASPDNTHTDRAT